MNPFQINRDRSVDQDKVFLVDKLFHPIRNGEIHPVSDLQIVANLNSNWECRFTVYRETDGIPCPLWDKITDLALVKIENKGIFELEAPITDEAGTYKQCSGKSICEAETSQTLMTLEINTDDDIARESEADPLATYYKELSTVFYRDLKDFSVFQHISNEHDAKILQSLNEDDKREILRRSSLLHRVFSEMPEYLENIDGENIDDSLKNLKHTFSWSDTSVYDICQDIAEEIQCIFIFDKFSRSFQVRDLKDHCEIDHCRDIQDGICPVCKQNGTTQKITSFGKFSGVEIDTRNLAETITLSGNKDSVKNYFKVEGADDIITDRISNRLIGNGYIWKTGALQRSQMSAELIAALEDREQMMTEDYDAGSEYQNIQDEYNKLWDQWNALESQKLYYESGMMPSPENADQTAEDVFNYLFGTNGKIDYAYASNCFQSGEQIADSVMKYAKLLISTGHTIEYTDLGYKPVTPEGYKNAITSISFRPHIYLDGHYREDEDGKKVLVDEYPAKDTEAELVTLQVAQGYNTTTTHNDKTVYTNDYYKYLKRILDTAMAKSDITDTLLTMDPVTDHDIDPEATTYTDPNTKTSYPLPSNHYSKYCYNRLDSFYNAYASCSSVIAGINGNIPSKSASKPNPGDATGTDATDASDTNATSVNILDYLKSDESTSNIQEDLLGKYQGYMERLSARMKWLQEQIKGMEDSQASLMTTINEIKETCDMKHCLTKYADEHDIDRNLWHELCSFRRQDTYRNENFFGEGVDDAKLMKDVEDLLKRAEEEIESACNITYSASATISNLLTLPEFEPFWDQFILGNYIHMVIDHQIHTMRLISITYDYSDLSHCSVEFSDVIRRNKNKTEEIADVLSRASSLASSAKTTSRQAEQGAAAKLSVDVIKNDALNLANSRIITADDQNFVIDKYGITGKYTDPISGEVSDEQIRIINNLLCFTDDNWQHSRTALGKISYVNPETKEYETKYGLIADTLIGNLILGEKLIISDQNGYVRIDGSGIELDAGTITWKNTITQDAVISQNAVNGLTENLSTLKDFKDQVNTALTGNSTTEIGEDYMISPKIGGGYLYIKEENNSIILNPQADPVSSKDDPEQKNKNYNMFEIISNNKTVLSVDKEGNLQLGSGQIGNSDTVLLSPGGIDSEAPIAGSSGSNRWAFTANNTFGVTTDGKLYAENAEISGKITATSGAFSGDVTSDSINMTGGNLHIPINTDIGETEYSEKITVSTGTGTTNEAIFSATAYPSHTDNKNNNYFVVPLPSEHKPYLFLKDVIYTFTLTISDSYGFRSSGIMGLLSNNEDTTPSGSGIHSYKCIKQDLHTFILCFKGDDNTYSHLCIALGDVRDYKASFFSYSVRAISPNERTASISPTAISVMANDADPQSISKSELRKNGIFFSHGNKTENLSFSSLNNISSSVDFYAPNLQEKKWKRISQNINESKTIQISTSSIFSTASEIIVSLFATNSHGNYGGHTWHVDPATVPDNEIGVVLLSGYKRDSSEGFSQITLNRNTATVDHCVIINENLINSATLTISYR